VDATPDLVRGADASYHTTSARYWTRGDLTLVFAINDFKAVTTKIRKAAMIQYRDQTTVDSDEPKAFELIEAVILALRTPSKCANAP